MAKEINTVTGSVMMDDVRYDWIRHRHYKSTSGYEYPEVEENTSGEPEDEPLYI